MDKPDDEIQEELLLATDTDGLVHVKDVTGREIAATGQKWACGRVIDAPATPLDSDFFCDVCQEALMIWAFADVGPSRTLH